MSTTSHSFTVRPGEIRARRGSACLFCGEAIRVGHAIRASVAAPNGPAYKHAGRRVYMHGHCADSNDSYAQQAREHGVAEVVR